MFQSEIISLINCFKKYRISDYNVKYQRDAGGLGGWPASQTILQGKRGLGYVEEGSA
jgi:hypothetical protein